MNQVREAHHAFLREMDRRRAGAHRIVRLADALRALDEDGPMSADVLVEYAARRGGLTQRRKTALLHDLEAAAMAGLIVTDRGARGLFGHGTVVWAA